MDLHEFDIAAWQSLSDAVSSKEAHFRYLTLGSVDVSGQPQSRVVVLRRVDADARKLEFHTDVRSSKWAEFSANAFATVLGYCHETQTQLRFSGMVLLHDARSELAKAAWQTLPAFTRATYQGGPPGDALPETTRAVEAEKLNVQGQGRFGVVLFTAQSLDWLRLNREGNKRAMFDYASDGQIDAAAWVNP